MRSRIVRKLIEEWLLVISGTGLVVTSLWLRRMPAYAKHDFEVVFTLLVFLVVAKGLENSGFLHNLARRVGGGRALGLRLVLLTAILSMLVTNDVALLTVVPLTLAMNVPKKGSLVILETLTANGASALTPFGNPQNIFIYYHYHLHPVEFVRVILLFGVVSLLFVVVVTILRVGRLTLVDDGVPVRVDGHAVVYLLSFVVFVAGVLHLLPLAVGCLPLIYALAVDRRSLRIDFVLLATFLAFFGFTDNLMLMLEFNIQKPTQVFLASAFGSQFISNVPSALLFADFTRNWQALLWGVSVGGFGNLIGSLASLISYRFYKAHVSSTRSFLLEFHLLSYLAFGLGILTYFVFWLCETCG